jgi:hypothetical protein
MGGEFDNIDAGGGWSPADEFFPSGGGDNIDAGGGWNPADAGWNQAGTGSTNYDGTSNGLYNGTVGQPTGTSPTSNGGGAGGNWWQAVGSLLQPLTQYAIARDAASHGLVTGYTANGQPVYRPQSTLQTPVGGMTTGGLLLLAGLAVVAVVATRAKG